MDEAHSTKGSFKTAATPARARTHCEKNHARANLATVETNLETASRAWQQEFRRRLLAWFRRSARVLPWRRTRDPYAIWVSEIMLQQTQVATVIPYFERFVARFPSAAVLAAAEEHEVLRLWEGLGYYRRARHLHAAARQIVERHAGEFPQQIDDVRRLPGIGRYTAGAILSIAFDIREPILEANTQRLLARLIAYRGPIKSAAGQAQLWQTAAHLLPLRKCGEFNQALMELGSLVCTPRNPNCSDCPVRMLCPTRANGWQQQIPAAAPPKAFESVRHLAVVAKRRNKVLLRQCGEGERFAGLWDFPRFPLPAAHPGTFASLAGFAQGELRRLSGLPFTPAEKIATLKHGVTRFRITLEVIAGTVAPGRVRAASGCRWYAPEQLAELPLSSTGRRIAGWLLASAAAD